MDNNQNNKRGAFERFQKPVSEFTEKVVKIKRVSKKTKGGNQIAFTALVVSGDKKSRVGVGHGRAKSVADAIQKAIKRAQKSMFTVPIVDGTIGSSLKIKFKGAIILLRPGKKGSGLIAGGPVRSVVELAGIKDLVSKIIGSRNKSVNVWATFRALKSLSH
ncbi:30S ribosomal protein S5 [Candidatus Shapirobacteria bacterium CG06_land_8_20_14_3_00_40_12]|uniref:Small ribosomal subunit protein uS5 n=2 Tax=Candidatus Shapironibacteriota TaxID=1752721 RepID=A0A2M7TTK5_9BACT|nr:MAG: 30S ribosomal protein S5 [Candidatus Shapirobacteria bacterium CG06_land_8_20_14_3_00_40_12]PIZ58926.1 MAG: 30S ribosomal protein S5 [Candidatus Shapirobacteria bacterium CG_4_10_14_0_2_um_filter_40_12]